MEVFISDASDKLVEGFVQPKFDLTPIPEDHGRVIVKFIARLKMSARDYSRLPGSPKHSPSSTLGGHWFWVVDALLQRLFSFENQLYDRDLSRWSPRRLISHCSKRPHKYIRFCWRSTVPQTPGPVLIVSFVNVRNVLVLCTVPHRALILMGSWTPWSFCPLMRGLIVLPVRW